MNEAGLVALVEDILTNPEYGGETWHRIAERIVSAVSAEIDGNYRNDDPAEEGPTDED